MCHQAVFLGSFALPSSENLPVLRMVRATLRTLPSDGGQSTLEGHKTSAGELTAPLSAKSRTVLL